jgi:hypothetical protein
VADLLSALAFGAVVFGPGLFWIADSLRRSRRRHRSDPRRAASSRYEALRLVAVRTADETDTMTIPRRYRQ